MHISGLWLGNIHCSGQPDISLGPEASSWDLSKCPGAGTNVFAASSLSHIPVTIFPVKAGSEGEIRPDHHQEFIAKLQRVIVKKSSNPQLSPELRRK